jgi:hypothetical protein
VIIGKELIMGFIEFERIWQDEDFFELRIEVHANNVSVSMNTYVSDKQIDELSNMINQFIGLKIQEFIWETGKKGNKSTPDFLMKEIDDGGKLEEHNCCFFIDDIEAAQLEKFGSRILKLKNNELCTCVNTNIIF